jgi:IclR family acetate operon transcriptional repressor
MCSEDQALTLTVKKAMDILDCLAGARKPLSCSEIGRRLGMPRSTAYRLLTTLAIGGYVVSDSDGFGKRYRLGFKILELASRLLDGMELRRQALPFLRELRDATEETVHLVVADGAQVTYIEKVDSLKTVRMHSAVGRQGYMHSTAVGKAILAYSNGDPTKTLEQQGLPALTPKTITSKNALLEELEVVREQGYAVDDGENEDGIRCVGAPVFDHQGEVIAALSVSGPSFRFSLERVRELSGVVKGAALQVSRQLGYRD